jgi:hypothetical protein
MAAMKNFNAWLIWYTGLSLYDYDVLSEDGDGTEEEMARLFDAWQKEEKPSQEQIDAAKKKLYGIWDFAGIM